MSLAYFDWASSHGAEWALVFGAPVPTYHAPADGGTTAAARRFGAVFTGLLAEGWDACSQRLVSLPLLQRRADAVVRFGDVELPDDPRFLGVATRLWSRLHGVVALGLFGHLLPATVEPSAMRTLYEAEVDDRLAVLGLQGHHRKGTNEGAPTAVRRACPTRCPHEPSPRTPLLV